MHRVPHKTHTVTKTSPMSQPPPSTINGDGRHAARHALAGGGRSTHAYAALLERAASGTLASVLERVAPVPPTADEAGGPSLHPARAAATVPLTHRTGASIHPGLQLGAQVAFAVGFASLFVLVDAVSFRTACNGVTYALVVCVMASPSPHVGSRLRALAAFPLPLAYGSLVAGACASASLAATRGQEPWYSIMLAVLVSLSALAPASYVRVMQSPPYAVGMGLITALGAGTTSLAAAASVSVAHATGTPLLHGHWSVIVAPTLCAGAVAIVAVLLATLLVFPTIASEAVESATAAALRGVGTSLSSTAARLFQARPAPIAPAHAAMLMDPVRIAPHVYMAREPQEGEGFAAWWDRVCAPVDTPVDAPAASTAAGLDTDGSRIRRRLAAALSSLTSSKFGEAETSASSTITTKPPRLDAAAPGPPAAALRPLLAAARAGVSAAAAEPACLRPWGGRAFDPGAWARLLAALDTLVTRVAALDAAAALGGGSLGDGAAALWGPGVAWDPEVRRGVRSALARAAAACAALSAHATSQGRAPLTPLCGSAAPSWRGGWAAADEELRRGLRRQVAAYVEAVRSAAAVGAPAVRPDADVGTPRAELSFDVAFDETTPPTAATSLRRDGELLLPSAFQARVRFYTFSLATAVVEAMERVDAAAERALCPLSAQPPPASSWFAHLAGVAVCAPAWWPAVQRCLRASDDDSTAPDASPEAVAAAARTTARVRVAGIKYWGVATTALAATLALIAASPAAARLLPMYGFAAAALSTSEKVEATAVKVTSWLVATVVGAVAGAALLTRGALPSHPAALGVAIAALAGTCALAGVTRWRLVVTLFPLTLCSVALCQYDATCRSVYGTGLRAPPRVTAGACSLMGTVAVAATRAASVVVGVLLAQSVCVCIHPWYVSDWSLDALASALRDGAAPLMEQQYAVFVEGSRAAAVAARRTDDAPVVRSPPRRKPGMSPASSLASALSSLVSSRASARAASTERTLSASLAAVEAPPPPPALFPVPARPLSLQRDVADRLVEVQASLARDATAWSRGVLATPHAVTSVLKSSLALMDALAALQVAARSQSPAGGICNGVLYNAYVTPAAPAARRVFDCLAACADAAAAHLETVAATRHMFPVPGGKARRKAVRAATRARLRDALAALVEARLVAIQAQAGARRAYMTSLAAAPDAQPYVCPDDTVRFLAFACAQITTVNRFVGGCRAALTT